MRRLWFFAISLLLVIHTGGYLIPEKSLAQTTPASPTTLVGGLTKERVMEIVNSYFDTSLRAVDESIEKNKLSLGAESQRYKDYVAAVPTIKSTISQAKALYNRAITTTYTSGQYQNLNLKDANDLAIDDVQKFLTAAQAGNPILQTAEARAPLIALSDGLNITTQQLYRYVTTANSTGPNGGAAQAEANLNSATKAAETKIINDSAITNPQACSLLEGNLLGCIDLLVAKIIKGVFLSIAGFLAWLAANLLNISIQISILDFSKWSPTSLYPIWIVIRQIVSLVVVFAGLYLGFMYIIGRQDTFGKYVGWLVIFALFVNFSYPVTRALVDVSNIVSLNVYSSAVGGDVLANNFSSSLTTAGANTAGAMIMDRLGVQKLFGKVTETGAGQGRDMTAQINSTPGALIAVIFVTYAAFVLFMATAIIVSRAAILSFLIIASPILLVDAVLPGLGNVAVRMRKLFFEQLVVAPVFMIMLALTLKFMDVFRVDSGPLAESGDGVKLFFNFLMMIIMLHITLKVTKSVAGEAGNYATNFIGKVGGFGLGVASGGAGFLARGTIGMAAARMRDSGWMDKMQGSRTGRGLYSLTNSLAQSTFDTRNIGMVSRGMTAAGMGTGPLGYGGMGQGLKQNYDQRFTQKDEAIKKKYGSIKDGDAREGYLAQKTRSLGSYGQRAALFGVAQSDAQKTAESIKKGEGDQIKKYNRIIDEDKKREYYDSLPKNLRDEIDKQNVPLNTKIPAGTKLAPTQQVDENLSLETPEQAELRVRGQQTEPVKADDQGVKDVKSQSFEQRAAEKRKQRQALAINNIDNGSSGPSGEKGPNDTDGTATPPPVPKPQTPSPAAETATI